MTDLLENIDATLETLEEQLLDEFIRIRNIGTAQEFGVINPSIKNALSGILEELVKERQQSTLDGSGLSLLTERDENINARLKVAQLLLAATIPTSVIEQAHRLTVQERRTLEQKVLQNRKSPTSRAAPGGAVQRKGLFGNRPTPKHASRNKIMITASEEKTVAGGKTYLDNGIYSASRELANLAKLLQKQGVMEPEQKPGQPTGKATFESHGLRKDSIRTKKDIAHSPEEIRRKLADRNSTISGASRFSARDLSGRGRSKSIVEPNLPEPRAKVAQTPDEIRQKLARRQQEAEARSSKATFQSKEIKQAEAAPKSRPRPPDPFRKPTDGKAVFQSQDVKHVEAADRARKLDPFKKPGVGKAVFQSREVQSREVQSREVKQTDPAPKQRAPSPKPVDKTSGKARFESRDLSKTEDTDPLKRR
jgi:hypothetical protein